MSTWRLIPCVTLSRRLASTRAFRSVLWTPGLAIVPILQWPVFATDFPTLTLSVSLARFRLEPTNRRLMAERVSAETLKVTTWMWCSATWALARPIANSEVIRTVERDQGKCGFRDSGPSRDNEGRSKQQRLATNWKSTSCEPRFYCSGGQGTRTLNPLRGAAFRMRLLAIRIPSGFFYIYSPGRFRARCRQNCIGRFK